MKILRQNIGEKAKLAKYTRNDMEPIEGASDDVKWYIVKETERPVINQFEVITTDYETTNKQHKKYPHFFIANEVHTINQLSNEQIIQQLDASLGSYLEENYPVWKRQRHEKQIRKGATPERLEYINSFDVWETNCIALRDQRESDLFNSGTLPELTWPNPPTVLKSTKI